MLTGFTGSFKSGRRFIPRIVTTDLLLWIDAAHFLSFSVTGTTAADLSGNGNDIAIFRVYNKILSSGEVSTNFNVNRGRFGL